MIEVDFVIMMNLLFSFIPEHRLCKLLHSNPRYV